MTEVEESERFKNEGNEWFKLAKYQKAIDSYTASIDVSPKAPVLCNRALCYLRIELPGAALIDAEDALRMDPGFIKAYYRKATAHLQLGKVKLALSDFKYVVQVVPDDVDAQAKLKHCEKEVKRIAFMNAIASEDTVPLSQRLKLDEISIPTSYTGPRIGGVITKGFVEAVQAVFEKENVISKHDMCQVLIEAIKFFQSQPNIVPITVPGDEQITVCGDTHGQYYDLLNIFKLNSVPSPSNPYLFNGDYVDRGSYSVETCTLLLMYKLLYPNHLFLSRGNHEGLSLNRVYGFEGEVKAKYDETVFNLFQEVFQSLPCGHTINDKVFVTHGGLFSQDNVKLEDLQKFRRFRDIPEEGHMCELLWSDPQPMKGRAPSKRGVGVSFGPDVTKNFLETNGFDLVIRSHEVKDEGYVVEHDGKCITVFSAPNYCDQMGNKGAYITLYGADISKPKFTTFAHVKHPGKRPMQYSSMGMGMMGM